MDSGIFYIVATPIGNLGDITLRALEVLKSVNLILAEDTRTSGILLKHYEISNHLESFHQHNEHKKINYYIELLQSGKNIAQVSDAGTPGISDPGFLLSRACLENGIRVEVIPGAAAFIPALLKSGFALHRFCFEGFLPQKSGRQKRLKEICEEKRTSVLYESPYKVVKTLEQMMTFTGPDRRVSVSRELTKKFEETVNNSIEKVIAHFKTGTVKGEFVIVLEGTEGNEKLKENDEA